METGGDQTHYVKRVVLPSGKTIEVVYFKEAEVQLDEPAQVDHAPAEPHQELHVCMECYSELVYPVHWDEAGPELWAWLRDGAHFYVCGDAQRMAKDVEAALIEVSAKGGQMSEAGARDFVAELKAAGRYQADVY